MRKITKIRLTSPFFVWKQRNKTDITVKESNYSVDSIPRGVLAWICQNPETYSKNAITEGDFKCIFARNREGTEQLRKKNDSDILKKPAGEIAYDSSAGLF